MSIQDSIQYNLNELDELSSNYDKEMKEIDNLIDEMNYYDRRETIDLMPFFVFLCYYLENINYQEKRIIEYEQYFYSNKVNLYYQYLNLIDYLIKVIFLNY